MKPNSTLEPYFSQELIEAGCDEAGRGPLAGPVVAAAVILPKDFNNPTLNDSKQLSASKREALRPIIENQAISWCVASVSAEEIDRINILKASILAMHRAIDGLYGVNLRASLQGRESDSFTLRVDPFDNSSEKPSNTTLPEIFARGGERLRPQQLIIDGNRFYKYEDIPHTCIIKGDGKYAPIAAASILAKTYRDEYMLRLAEQFPQYGWDRNMAYPTKEHRQAILQYGTTPQHRLSFRLIDNEPTLF